MKRANYLIFESGVVCQFADILLQMLETFSVDFTQRELLSSWQTDLIVNWTESVIPCVVTDITATHLNQIKTIFEIWLTMEYRFRFSLSLFLFCTSHNLRI